MNSRKHQKLKRNPFVRFIRGVFRLLRVLVRPKQRSLRSIDEYPVDRSIEAISPSNRLPTNFNESDSFNDSDFSSAISGSLVGKANQATHPKPAHLMTIGELLDSVKWQVPEVTTLQANIADESTIALGADYSRN